jgi:hypothetical protein
MVSALVAYVLRYAFIDLFQYQKELYWAAALLALGAGTLGSALGSSGRRGALAAALLLLLFASYAVELREMADQFYRNYLFL